MNTVKLLGRPFLLVLAAAAVTLLASTPAHAQDTRYKWTYDGGYFQIQSGGAWIEATSGVTYNYVEVSRSRTGIQLYDASRNYNILLAQNAASIQGGFQGSPYFPYWTKLYSGAWTVYVAP